MKRGRNPKKLVGERIGRLEVLREEPYITRKGNTVRGYLCHCDCGKEKVIRRSDLISRKTNSCGCLIKEFNKCKKGNDYWKYRSGKRKSTIKGDKTKERLHRIWKNMKQRCTNPNFPDYIRYGARGISICDEWIVELGFQNFYRWSIENGYADSLTIDRINNDDNYCPDNCRWITYKEQNFNKRTNRNITYKGITKTKTEWAEILGVKQSNFNYRIKKNLSDEEILLGKRNETVEKNKAILQKYFNQ